MPSLKPKQAIRIKGAPHICERSYANGDWLLTNAATLRPLMLTHEDFQKAYLSGEVDFYPQDHKVGTGFNPGLVSFAAIAEKAKQGALRKYHYVKAVLSIPGKRTVAEIQAAIDRIAKKRNETAPHISAVYKWLLQHQPSNDIRSLVSRVHLRGPRDPRLPALVHDVINTILDDDYMSARRCSIKICFQNIICKIVHLNKSRSEDDQLPKPSLATVGRAVKALDPYDVLVARYGKAIADKKYRVYGRGPVSVRPFQRVEVDHTLLDIIVTCGVTGVSLGRPTMTVAIDHCTKMPLGIYIGFEVPSTLSVALCIRNAILPKTYMKEKWPQIKNLWPAEGIWNLAVFDNGKEFHGHGIISVLLSLGTDVHYMPTGTPHYKGGVERFFRTIQDDLIHSLPGTTWSNVVDRGLQKPEKDACLTIEDLIGLVHHWIADIYNVRKHRSLGESPLDCWNRLIQQCAPSFPQHINDLDALKGGIAKRVINTYGIEIFGLKYSDPKLLTEINTSPKTPKEVEIRYDPGDLGTIKVLNYDTLQYVTIPSTNPEYTNGLTLYRHQVVKAQAKADGADEKSVVELALTQEKLMTTVQEAIDRKRRQKRVAGKSTARLIGMALKGVDGSTTMSATPPNHDAYTQAQQMISFINDVDAENLLEEVKGEFNKELTFHD